MSLFSVFKRLQTLLDAERSDVYWALTGSFAFYLRGIDVSVHHIDIQTDDTGAYAIGQVLEDHGFECLEPVHYKQSDSIRSHFGRFRFDDVVVEIMGDIEKSTPDGKWKSTPPLTSLIETVIWEGLYVPVLNLEYEYQAYELLGRKERARVLREWLDGEIV